MFFRYKKLNAEGLEVVGAQEFGSLAEAQSKLAESGELLLELHVISKKRKYKFNMQDRLEFTYQMHQLIHAGLPIYESLISLKEKRVKLGDLVFQLSEKIKEGKTLSTALKQYPEAFNPLYVAIIQASEASGEIKEGFYALKVLLEKQSRLIKILKNAFIYPCILLVFSFLIVLALLFFIIPSLKELFEGRSVNGLTSFVLDTSQFCLDYTGRLVMAFIAVTGLIVYLNTKGILKKWFYRIIQDVPFFTSLILMLKFENFFSCLSLLLSRGVNLTHSLLLSKGVLNHPYLEKNVDEMISNIIKGKKLSESISSPFPPVVKRLIGLSEITGKMGEACSMLATIFQEDVEKKLQQLTSFLQPALLMIIGLIIGLVILSILVPLTDVGGFI